MKSIGLVSCVAVVGLAAAPAAGQSTGRAGPSSTTQPARGTVSAERIRTIVRGLAPAIVTIETVGGTQPSSGTRGRANFRVADGPTTGLIWSSDGLILTSSFNFVRNPTVITVVMHDGRRFIAELLARDEVRKLAMLRIDAANLPMPVWHSSVDHVRVGQQVLALGRAYRTLAPDADDLAIPSVSLGIVSGLDRFSGLAVQTDANLSPANFGGPLVTLDGRVVGVCVPMGLSTDALAGVEWYDSGIGFAIPEKQIRRTAESLAVGHTVRNGHLGLAFDPATTGILRVAAVADPSPALRAGIEIGDVILAIDGRALQRPEDLRRALRPRHAGERVTLRIRHDDKELDVPITLAVLEDLGPISQPATQPDSPLPTEWQPAQ